MPDLSSLIAFLGSNSVGAKAVAGVGKTLAETEIELLIATGTKVNTCTSASQRKRSPAEIARTQHRCDFGLTKCGVYTGLPAVSHTFPPSTTGSSDYSRIGAYECLDTMTNLESCGGCMEPYTLGLTTLEIAELQPGVDCTADAGVSDVECRRGRCIVHKCKKGYQLVPVVGDADNLFECVAKNAEGEMHKQVGGVLEWRKE